MSQKIYVNQSGVYNVVVKFISPQSNLAQAAANLYLNDVHFPVHELAMMMSIALRFIPTLIEETDKIMNAQKARGAMLDNGSMMERVKALVPVLIPLFISAFRRADELAMAMECRCYRGGDGRTRLKVLRCTRQDYIDLAVCIVCFMVILSSRLVFPNF